MYFIPFLTPFIRCVLTFVRTLATLLWRVPVSYLRLRYIRQINMESDDECDFDSTWEDDNANKEPKRKIHKRSDRNMYAAKDMQDFRHRVRDLDKDDEPVESHFYNLEFYRGKIKSSPDDVHIDDFHQNWLGDYNLLENCHSYIQWLFPIQERGVNWDAHVLTKKEIKAFRKDEAAKRKLVKSYELMLDFYGIRLVKKSSNPGEVERADNWKERFSNLNRYSHNNLRITRILKCLGTLGLQHYQAPLVKFFLHETLEMKQLQRVKQSVLDYFMFAVLDKSERRELVRFAFKNFKPQKQFVWGPKKFLSGEVEQDPDGDAKMLGEVRSENENVGRLTENRAAEDGQERETSERTIEMGSDKNNKDEQDPDKNSSNYKKEEKQDQEPSNDCNEEHSKPQENLVKSNESVDEMNIIDANPEGMGGDAPDKKDHLSIDKPDTTKKMTEEIIESNEKPNEDSENESGKKNLDKSSEKVLSSELNSKNESLNQLKENKDNSTHEEDKIDSSNVKGVLNKENSGKDQQGKTGSNENNEDERDDANENSQCSSNNKTAEKQDLETIV